MNTRYRNTISTSMLTMRLPQPKTGFGKCVSEWAHAVVTATARGVFSLF